MLDFFEKYSWVASSAISIISVVIGAFLGHFLSNRDKKPKISIVVTYSNGEDVTPIENRTKYSDTEFCIELFNLGSRPIVLDEFILKNKNKMVPCTLVGKERIVAPFQSVSYNLNQQELDNIIHWKKVYGTSKCKIIMCMINGEKLKQKMDLSLFNLGLPYDGEM